MNVDLSSAMKPPRVLEKRCRGHSTGSGVGGGSPGGRVSAQAADQVEVREIPVVGVHVSEPIAGEDRLDERHPGGVGGGELSPDLAGARGGLHAGGAARERSLLLGVN